MNSTNIASGCIDFFLSRILDTACWILDTRCWMLDICCSEAEIWSLVGVLGTGYL